MSMHGLYTSTQHLDETLEPLNWIRICPSHCDEHSSKHSHVLYYISCNISKYTTFKPHNRPSFCIFIPSTGYHLKFVFNSYKWRKMRTFHLHLQRYCTSFIAKTRNNLLFLQIVNLLAEKFYYDCNAFKSVSTIGFTNFDQGSKVTLLRGLFLCQFWQLL